MHYLQTLADFWGSSNVGNSDIDARKGVHLIVYLAVLWALVAIILQMLEVPPGGKRVIYLIAGLITIVLVLGFLGMW